MAVTIPSSEQDDCHCHEGLGGAGGVGRILHISCKMEKTPSASL